MKISLPFLAMAVAFPVWALRPGDPAEELNVKWLQGTPVTVLPPATPQPGTPEYKVVVFLLTRAANRVETLVLLDRLRRDYADLARIAAVTPDSESDAGKLLADHADQSIPFGVDTRRQSTPKYMNGSILYPMAFLIDGKGTVVWNGEAVDLGETLQKVKNGTFDADLQRKLAPLQDELQTLLRDGNDRRMKQITEAILRLDPGNPGAIRIRLFVFENSGRTDEAWALVAQELGRQPQLERLYFTAIDLAARHPELAGRAVEAAQAYRKNISGKPDSDNLMGWTLLNRFPMDPEILKIAAELINRAAQAIPADASPALRGAGLNAQALLANRLGEVDKAAALQTQAVAEWEKSGMTAAMREAQARAAYFETVKAMRDGR